MFNVIIADDDLIIRKGLSSIAWETYNLNLIGIACDGEEALNLVNEYSVDIVITDIKMPFIDGIQLCEILHYKYPEIRTILLSGYGEFEYAKKAIEFNVYQYLLKPLNNQTLIDVIVRLVDELTKVKQTKKIFEESIPLATQTFLTQVIHRKIKCNEKICCNFKDLKLKIPLKGYMTAVILPDDLNNKNFYENVLDHELLLFSIMNITRELLNRCYEGILLPFNNEKIIMFLYSNTDEIDAFSTESMLLFKEIHKEINQLLKTSVTIGISQFYTELSKISMTYDEAMASIQYRHLLGKGQTIFFKETGFPVRNDKYDISKFGNQLLKVIRKQENSQSEQLFNEIREHIVGNAFTPMHCVVLSIFELCILILSETQSLVNCEDYNAFRQELNRYHDTANSFRTVDELIIYLKVFVLKIKNAIFQNNQGEIHIIHARGFIKSNYSNENLNLQMVADYIHVSAIYLSILFSKYSEVTFSNYITQIRMEKAKELIETTCMKSCEICELIGYKNPQYFSTCFKKYTKLSPSKYRHAVKP